MSARLAVQPLTRAGFAPFGDVIETKGAERFAINQGTCERYHDLARLDVSGVGGKAIISIFEARPRRLPLRLEVMERHPLGSQAFYPLQPHDWLVIVASGDDPTLPENLAAFRASGTQGVNYARNVWHHPLVAVKVPARFVVIDRKGPGDNLQEVAFDEEVLVG